MLCAVGWLLYVVRADVQVLNRCSAFKEHHLREAFSASEERVMSLSRMGTNPEVANCPLIKGAHSVTLLLDYLVALPRSALAHSMAGFVLIVVPPS